MCKAEYKANSDFILKYIKQFNIFIDNIHVYVYCMYRKKFLKRT